MSADGTRMIGHMVLRKSVVEGSSHSSAAILGLKVVGGKLLPDGTRVAIVEKVKKGSIADLEGQLRIGEFRISGTDVPRYTEVTVHQVKLTAIFKVVHFVKLMAIFDMFR